VKIDWRGKFKLLDFIPLVAFSALAIVLVFNPSIEHRRIIVASLLSLGVVQVLEPFTGHLISVTAKLALCYGLIYYSGGISSSFYYFLLLPVITAGINFGFVGTTVVSAVTTGLYLSFVLFLEEDQFMPPEAKLELAARLAFLFLPGFFLYRFVLDKERETQRYQVAAEELATANKNLKEVQAQVRRSERLAALGQLTAGLAHELRNPMGTMKSSAELLSRHVEKENDIAREMAGYISSEVDRTNAIIGRFLEFARPRSLQLETAPLEPLLDHVIEQVNREKKDAAANVTIEKDCAADVPTLEFDAQLMERVFSNLIMNAAQASNPGGVVTVKTSRNGDGIEIDVIDRGTGIDPKNLESIFNPFFTTKPDGVGLGLAIVSKIVDDHGGKITVESVLGEGTTFRVRLPLLQQGSPHTVRLE
jgi:signal transduction histidine kinase